MASRHMKQDGNSLQVKAVMAVVVGALAIAVVSVFMVVRDVSSDVSADRIAVHVPAAPAPVPLSQEGRIVAVSPTSVTAESTDGFARTYALDPQTNAITRGGSVIGGASTVFAVNDEVAIVGVVRDGTPVATAVAEKEVSNLNGPPMDGL